MEKCTFCDIVIGKIKTSIVFDDNHTLCFLDKKPIFHGHCLIIPKQHIATLEEVPKSLLGLLFWNARLLSEAIENALGAEGTFIALNNKISQSVPHIHVHVVPRRHKDGLRGFFWPRTKYENDEQAIEIARKIASSFKQISKERGEKEA
ncbi:MAG TPA: HIT family protein [Fimbriimonadales bacterium]|nr:HIT family protein [Fimbriimonadales bacterium]